MISKITVSWISKLKIWLEKDTSISFSIGFKNPHQNFEAQLNDKWIWLWDHNFSTQKMYTREPQLKRFYPNGDLPIMFREEETKQLDLEHDDMLVVSLKIANSLVKNVIIDTELNIYIIS